MPCTELRAASVFSLPPTRRVLSVATLVLPESLRPREQDQGPVP